MINKGDRGTDLLSPSFTLEGDSGPSPCLLSAGCFYYGQSISDSQDRFGIYDRL